MTAWFLLLSKFLNSELRCLMLSVMMFTLPFYSFDCLIAGHSVLDRRKEPLVFRPPGSGSVIICTDPNPSINKQKYGIHQQAKNPSESKPKSSKTLISTVLWLLINLLPVSLKTDVSLRYLSNKQKTFTFLAGILKATEENTRIRIRNHRHLYGSGTVAGQIDYENIVGMDR